MKITKAFTIAAATLCSAIAAVAQDTTQELYNVKLRATCKPSDGNNGGASKLTHRDLIRECVGTGVSQRELTRNFALVYNPAADRLQVVHRNDGSLVCDVFIFDGGTNAVADDQLTRFVFVFRPDQSEAIGSAVITERASNNDRRARITALIQFAHTGHTDSDGIGEAAAANLAQTPDRNGNNRNSDRNNGTDRTDGNDRQDDTNDGNAVGNNVGTVDPLAPTGFNDRTNSQRRAARLARTAQNDSGTADRNRNGDGAAQGQNTDFVQASAAAIATTDAHVDICTGRFVVGKRFEPGARDDGDDQENETDTPQAAGTAQQDDNQGDGTNGDQQQNNDNGTNGDENHNRKLARR